MPQIKADMVVFPNPATHQNTIRSKNNIDLVKIYDMNMREAKRSKTLDINTSSLPRGIYLIESSFEERILDIQKLILIK